MVRNLEDVRDKLSQELSRTANRRRQIRIGGHLVKVEAVPGVLFGKSMSTGWDIVVDALTDVSDVTLGP
jgi:hypothetical protein